MTDGKDAGKGTGEDGDELDPSDWLASQFETSSIPTEPPPLVPPAVVSQPPRPPVVPPTTESLGVPASQFSWGLTPAASEPPPEPAPEPLPAATEPTPPADPALAGAPPYEPPPTEAIPSQDLEPRPWEPWQARPVDASLDGATEVIEAELIGLDGPEGESNPQSPIDDIFGAGEFREYVDEPIIPGAGGPPPKAPKAQWAPLTKNQKILLWVAGGLVAVLALVALFLVGQRLSSNDGPAPTPAPTPTASPTPTPTATALPAGPLPPGEYEWSELLGGECLAPFESAWQETYTVVDCATPHPAQMILRGQFEDAPDAAYPGLDALTSRIGILCTAPTVINYQVAGTAQDIQVTASFAADAADWESGNRTFFCFANRSSGADLTASIAQPQPAPQ